MGFVILLLALAVTVLIFAAYCYKITFHVPKKRHEDIFHIPKGEQYEKWGQKMVEISLIMDSAPVEWVGITASDGSALWGRYYEYYPGAPLIIAFHGYRSMALRDCAGAFALAQKLGFNILAVDQRSHGRSDGDMITFGIRERHDCVDWVRYAQRRFGKTTPIVLSGISMGAATVLMAADLKLPENVQCILADCPYASPSGIICKVAKDMGYPKCLAWPVIRLSAKLFGDVNIKEAAAEESVKAARIPILLIHGEDDRFIPWEMSKQIYKNCKSRAQLHTFPDAGHGLCYIVDPRRYEKICVDFLWSIDALRPALEKSEFAVSVHEK